MPWRCYIDIYLLESHVSPFQSFLIPPTIRAFPASLCISFFLVKSVLYLYFLCRFFLHPAFVSACILLTIYFHTMYTSTYSCKTYKFSVLGILVSVTYFMCAFQINFNAGFQTQLNAFVAIFCLSEATAK